MSSALQFTFFKSRESQIRMGAIAAVFGLLGLLYGLLAPKWYRSEIAVVAVSAPKGGGLSSLLSGSLGGLAAGLEGPLGGSADTGRIAAVLQSNGVSDAVIDKLDLMTRYSSRYRETAREDLWSHCSVKAMPKPNLVELSCEDKDPRFVQEMLASFAEFGNEAFRRVSVSSASEEARFLERRVADLRRQADEAAQQMREFQETHQIIDLESQARAVVTSMAAIQGQRIAKQLELDYARTFSAADEAAARRLGLQVEVMNDRMDDLEGVRPPSGDPARKTKSAAGEGGVFPRAMAVPKLRAEYEKLYRDRKVAEATLVFALERLENARANEARDVSTFVVMDRPVVPTRPERPRPLRLTAIALVVGLLVGVAYEFSKGGIFKALKNADP